MGRENFRLSGKLLVFVAVMGGFGFALVPMYRAICDALGINVLALSEQRTSSGEWRPRATEGAWGNTDANAICNGIVRLHDDYDSFANAPVDRPFVESFEWGALTARLDELSSLRQHRRHPKLDFAIEATALKLRFSIGSQHTLRKRHVELPSKATDRQKHVVQNQCAKLNRRRLLTATIRAQLELIVDELKLLKLSFDVGDPHKVSSRLWSSTRSVQQLSIGQRPRFANRSQCLTQVVATNVRDSDAIQTADFTAQTRFEQRLWCRSTDVRKLIGCHDQRRSRQPELRAKKGRG